MKTYRSTSIASAASCYYWLPLAVLWMRGCLLAASPLVSSNELVFLNVDHAPMGACSSLTYGYKGAICGLGTSTGIFPGYQATTGGVLMGLWDGSGLQILPFVGLASEISTNAQVIPDASVQRRLTPCTDDLSVPAIGFDLIHYTPAWRLDDLTQADMNERKRCFLPATWLVFNLTNTNSTAKDFYFGLTSAATQRSFGNGAYQGFSLGEAAFAVQTGSCELLSGAALTAVFEGMSKGFAFRFPVPAGQSRSVTVVLAFYRSAVLDSRLGAHYYYTSLYPSIDSVIESAFAGLGDARLRCQQMASALTAAGLNPYRQFMASHALHSYMANTACLVDPQGGVRWREPEGFFNYINTFDLTVDHAFFDALMHPWALRNVLDAFSGALPNTGYTFETPLYSADSGAQVSTHGFSFHHDMGYWPNSGTGPAYSTCMGLEELQAWILSAGIYWSHTRDNAWLSNNAAVLQNCLSSLLLRDNTNPAARDGVPKNINAGEITTYDNLDPSLQQTAYSARMTVRNWASYLALKAMFTQIGDATDAAACGDMAATAANTVVNRWNSYRGTLGYIPALLNGSSTAATIPLIESLAYPAVMGLTNEIDRTSGPYASMLQALSNHMVAVLVPGRCLGSPPGGWVMTTGNWITWQSKLFLSQYAAETVLGLTNDTVNGSVDQVHASIQYATGPCQGWVDAVDGTGTRAWGGGPHYPRAITSALWWLSATNNPEPVPATGGTITATLGASKVIVSWPSNYQGWVLQTNTLGLRIPTVWGDVPASVTNSQMEFPTGDPAIPAQFFRLRRP